MQDPPSISTLLAELASFADFVEGSLSSSDIDWDWRPGEDEWSLTEVMCHLRDVEKEIHQVRFHRLMASDEEVFLSGEDSDVWVAERQYHLQDGPTAEAEFIASRRQTVSLLGGIKDESQWERSGRHAFFGLTSMHELLHLAVRHDRVHKGQIMALLRGSKKISK